ncbi:MAG: acyl-CoA dehydrogenase family protein [Acidimicrobiales bacterium]
MDFSFTDEQQEARALTRRILEDKVTEDLLRAAEAAEIRFDPATWSALADAGLLGLGLPVEHGGGGLGLVEQCVVLEEVGRTVAPVPVAASTVFGAAPLARFGTEAQRARWLPAAAEGRAVLTAALSEPGNRRPERPVTRAAAVAGCWRLDGVKTRVPAGAQADAVVLGATTDDGRPALFLVERDTPGLVVEPQAVTSGHAEARLTLDGVVVGADAVVARPDVGAEALDWSLQRSTVALGAQQLGVLSRALELTAAYSKERVQFDVPIATFQAVGHRLADCYIDVEGLRLTLWQAVWHLEEGCSAATEVEVAKFWAAEAGHRVAHAAVHIHGGMGIADDYPLHRYFLAAKSIELALGGATDQLLRIGARFAE